MSARSGTPPAELAVLTPDSWTEPFWQAAAEHRLTIPRCRDCGTYRMPPSPFCWKCQSSAMEWVEHSGEGAVYSFTVVRHPVIPQVADAVPYVVAVVALADAGDVRLISNIVDVDPNAVTIGMPVMLVWDDVADDVAVPRFRAKDGA
jgi:uncharacterized OB-fold protein